MATVLRPVPSVDEARRVRQFWDEHYEQLLREYPDKYVAVRDGQVVAVNDDLALLVYDLRDKGLDVRRDVDVEFVSERMARLLL